MDRSGPQPARGFTLVELVMVMLIIGVLAVFALPRLLDLGSWQLRAYADELRAQTQAMQRLALVQRRPVQMSISPAGVDFAYVGGAALLSLPCPAASTPCIAEAGTRSLTFNEGNSGRSVSASGAALALTLGSGAGALAYRLEHETGLLRPAP